MERSISRAELQDEVLSSSPESIALDKLQVFDEIEYVQPIDAYGPAEETEQEATAFRLFAPAQNGQHVDQIQTIRVRSLTPEVQEAGFVQPGRKSSYYFASANDTFAQAAVSGADIRGLAELKWPGMAYPWKVLDLPATQVTRAAKQALQTQAWSGFVAEGVTKRRRPGKKARIKVRVKLAALKTKAIELKSAQEAKDVAQREKKTRLNREKKAKKRQREKAKRAAARADGTAGDDGVADSDVQSDSS